MSSSPLPLSVSLHLCKCLLFILLRTEMRPRSLGCPPIPPHQWAPGDRSNTKKGSVRRRVWGSSQHLLSPGPGKNETWVCGRQHVKLPQPRTHGKHFKRPRYSSKQVCMFKDQPRYFTFVSRVRLWDRGQTHNHSHLQSDPDGPSLPCPRFVAHMNTSSGSLQLPWNFTRRPRTLYPGTMDPESCTSTREIWKSAAHSKHPARWYCCLQFKPSSKPQPKSSPPSEVSSGEDEVKLCAGHRKTPPGTSEQNPAEVSDAHRGQASSEEFWSDAELGDPRMEEVDVLGESFSPLQSRMENTTSHDSGQALNVSSQGCGFSLHRYNNETDTWDRQPSSGTGSSTDLSQLRCSSFSWNSRTSTGSKLQAGSSAQSDRIHLRNASPLAVSSLYQSSVNLDQSACGRHSTSDPLHVSSCAARESPTERTLSFVEIWHDRLLKHWPVLPPISPQTGSLEACSYGSDSGAMHSYSDLSAYEELDEIIPCTGSSLSHHTLGDTAEERSESDLTRRSPVSQTPSTSAADRTLAEARLALLDHQGFDQGRDINLLEELLAQATIAESMESMARGEREVEGGRSKINGSLSPCPPDNLSERKPTPTQRPNKDDVDLDCNTTMTDWSGKAAPLSRAIPSPGGTRRQYSTPVEPEPRTTALPEKVHSSEVTPSPNKEGQGSPTPPVGAATELKPDLDPASNRQHARTPGAWAGRWVSRGTSGDLPPVETARPLQETRAGGMRAFGKRWAAESRRQSGPVVTSVSNVEEFNFLEKYCIFNRDDLALYKKKFQEVDNNNDGYLSCAELVRALKEMVPLGALTDSEETYIYRILESLDYHVTDGLTDLRLFTVMVSLAKKITALDGFMRSLIGNMDLKALDLKVHRAKQLFLCNLEAGSSTISAKQFLLELKAGGISRMHEEEVRQALQHTRELDLLDFLTYLPLFILIHNSVVSNPLDNSATL